jgi:hypothetical protein
MPLVQNTCKKVLIKVAKEFAPSAVDNVEIEEI